MKKILILGGTQFIGRNLVKRLQSLGEYELTLFNRQQTQANLFPDLKKIKGDRETDDIQQIAAEKWDYIIDLSCYLPVALKGTLDNIKGTPEKYIFISTCSVYNDENNHTELRNEEAAIHSCTKEQALEKTLKYYGHKKAECERILQNSGLNHVILRPSLVYGAYDHTDRFYYWLHQVKYKEALLLPDYGERKFSMTYVKDLVETIVQLLTKETKSNIFNVITTSQNSIGEITETAGNLLLSEYEIINASPDFLKENEISQWFDMPLWINGDFFTYSSQRLVEELGIDLSDFQNSTRETIAYYQSLGWPKPSYGMAEEKRLELLGMLCS